MCSDINFLTSPIPPCEFEKNSNPHSIFKEVIDQTSCLRIASGYISTDSISILTEIVRRNNRPRIELLIGMHYFDGFTKPQYNATMHLHAYLVEQGLGFVSLATAFKYHGKLYHFSLQSGEQKALLGSSNLGCVIESINNQYEVDVLFKSPEECLKIKSYIDSLNQKIGTEINNVAISSFRTSEGLLEGFAEVDKISAEELSRRWKNRGTQVFKLPLKDSSEAPKSNLNVYFGKGRQDKREFVIPRPWYEVELIVPNSITRSDGYPSNRIFTVITDDGWMFKCQTQGDYAKNFRSAVDLKILGKWLKGRLEDSGCLVPGSAVDQLVLDNYGRRDVELISTSDPDLWLMDFSRNG
jgi:hypothetical protein